MRVRALAVEISGSHCYHLQAPLADLSHLCSTLVASSRSQLDALCHHTSVYMYTNTCREIEFQTCRVAVPTWWQMRAKEEPLMTARCHDLEWVVWPNWSENSSMIRRRRQRQDMMSWEDGGVPCLSFFSCGYKIEVEWMTRRGEHSLSAVWLASVDRRRAVVSNGWRGGTIWALHIPHWGSWARQGELDGKVDNWRYICNVVQDSDISGYRKYLSYND